MNLIFSEKVKTNQTAFLNKVVYICQKLEVDPNWLMAIMNFESGLNPQKENPKSKAVGLIQFMPDTAILLGTSVEKLKAMSNIQQLDYVWKYLVTYKKKIKSFIDLYFAVFFPLAIGKPLTWIIEAKKLSRSKIAEQNPVFDINKDNQITVAEVQEIIFSRIPVAQRDLIKKKLNNSLESA